MDDSKKPCMTKYALTEIIEPIKALDFFTMHRIGCTSYYFDWFNAAYHLRIVDEHGYIGKEYFKYFERMTTCDQNYSDQQKEYKLDDLFLTKDGSDSLSLYIMDKLKSEPEVYNSLIIFKREGYVRC